VRSRRQHQQHLRIRGELPHPPQEGLFEPVTDGQWVGQRIMPVALFWGQLAGSFEDGQRVAACCCDDPRGYAWVDRSTGRPLEKLVGVALREAADAQARERPQAGVEVGGLPDGEQQPDPVGQQPACHEAEDIGRLLVQPLRIVDRAEDRPGLGGVGEQRQYAEAAS